MVDQDLAHGDRRDGQKMAAVGKRRLGLVHQAQVRLMDEGRRVQCLSRTQSAQLCPGDAPEILIDERDKLVECASLPSSVGLKEGGNVHEA